MTDERIIELDPALREFDRRILGATREELPPEPERATRNGHLGPEGERARNEQTQPLPLASYASLARRPRIAKRFLIEGLVPEEEGMLLSAKERSFKSFLTMEFCKATAAGRPLFGRYAAPQARTVVLLDLENTRSRLCDRMDAALAHDGLGPDALGDRLHIFDRDQMQRWVYDACGLARLEATIALVRPALVVVDNLRKATPPGKDEKESKDMLPVASTLAQMCETHHCALILVHHDRRDGSGYSGSGSLAGSMANDVHVSYDRKTRIATVRCESMRNAEPFEPFAIAMGRGGALVLVDLPPEDEEADDHGGKVLDALKDGAKSVGQIADLKGLSERQVRPTIARLVATRAVVELLGQRQGTPGRSAVLYALPAQL